MAGIGCAFLPMRIYGEDERRRELRVIECRPQIDRLEHFAVREITDPNPVLDAVENVATFVARLAAAKLSG